MPEPETSSSDTLQRVVGIIARGRWLILLTASVVVLATVVVLYQLPNRYTSEATLLVVPQQVPARYVTPTTETNIADALQAMTQDVLSRARLLELIDQFGLYPKERQRLAPEEVIELMRKYIEIQPMDPAPGRKEITSFKISFVAEKAILAQEVTSKLTSFFIQANLKTREDQAASTTNFLRDALEAAKTRLTAQEERVRDFKTQYLGELPEQQPGNLAILSGAQLQLQNIAASLDRAQQQRAYLESLLTGYRRLMSRGSPVPGVTLPEAARSLTPLQTAQNDLARLQAEKDRLVATYNAQYPDVRALSREIEAKQALVAKLQSAKTPDAGATPDPARTAPAAPESADDDSSITQLKSQLESNRLEIDNLIRDEAQQKTVIAQYQNRLNMTPVREQQLAGILRDYDLSKLDYADLLGKEQQSQLAANLEKQQGGQQFRLVEPPSLPFIPSSPKRVKIGLGGLGAGLVLGLLAAFVKDLTKPSLRTPKEVSQRFNAPLVIGIPAILTVAEVRRHKWKTKVELLGGSVLTLVICAAELYVLRHP
jgi:polysaccharide chain length determinant protein (PEP-CTERM system associated)